MGDGPRYFRVSPKFWADSASWSDDAKLLALYLLTCPHRTTEGLYRLPRQYAQADLGWDREAFDKAFAELLDAGFISYDDGAQVVLIRKALKYQAPENDNQARGAIKSLAELPETRLWPEFRQLAERYSERLGKRLAEAFGERYGNPHLISTSPLSPPSPDPESGSDRESAESDADDADGDEQRITDSFEQFWQAYPRRHGKKPGKGNALIEWRKLTWDQRRRAYTGAVNLAASEQMPKDAERFLRRSKGGKGDFPFDDWQDPATPPANGRPPRGDDDYDPDQPGPAPGTKWAYL